MAEVIIFPKHQQCQWNSEEWIAATKRALGKKKFPKSGPRVRSAPFVEIMPQVTKDLRCVMEVVERDAREGREELATLIGMYEYMLDVGRVLTRTDVAHG